MAEYEDIYIKPHRITREGWDKWNIAADAGMTISENITQFADAVVYEYWQGLELNLTGVEDDGTICVVAGPSGLDDTFAFFDFAKMLQGGIEGIVENHSSPARLEQTGIEALARLQGILDAASDKIQQVLKFAEPENISPAIDTPKNNPWKENKEFGG